MKKASQIILLIGGIFAIIGIVSYFLAAIFYVAIGSLGAAIASGAIDTSDLPAQIVDIITRIEVTFGASLPYISGMLIGLGVLFIIFMAMCIPAAVLSFLARSKEKKALYITCIVFGVLSTTLLPTVGGVLGLIAKIKEDKQQQA